MGSVPTFGHVLNRRYNSVLIQDSWEWWGTRAFGAPSYRDAAAVGRFGEGWACKPSPSNLTASVRKCKNRPVGGFYVFLAAVRAEQAATTRINTRFLMEFFQSCPKTCPQKRFLSPIAFINSTTSCTKGNDTLPPGAAGLPLKKRQQ